MNIFGKPLIINKLYPFVEKINMSNQLKNESNKRNSYIIKLLQASNLNIKMFEIII